MHCEWKSWFHSILKNSLGLESNFTVKNGISFKAQNHCDMPKNAFYFKNGIFSVSYLSKFEVPRKWKLSGKLLANAISKGLIETIIKMSPNAAFFFANFSRGQGSFHLNYFFSALLSSALEPFQIFILPQKFFVQN